MCSAAALLEALASASANSSQRTFNAWSLQQGLDVSRVLFFFGIDLTEESVLDSSRGVTLITSSRTGFVQGRMKAYNEGRGKQSEAVCPGFDRQH